MTRPTQKKSERQTLDAVLAALGVKADREPEEGEAPDFTIPISGQTIGAEITMYRSGTTVDGGFPHRTVESEWERLQRLTRIFQVEHPDLRQMNVGLMFKSEVPPRNEHQAFIEEIAGFIRQHASELGAKDTGFWEPHFSSPLMGRYLRTLYLRINEFAEWYSNITAGWVGLPDKTLVDIITEKSATSFRPTDRLWLAIQCSHRISETVLPIHGVTDFNTIPGLTAALHASRFSRVFILAFNGVFGWERATGWSKLAGETPQAQGPSFDEIKGILSDPEWLADPDGKAMRVAMECVRELRNKG